MFLYFSKMHSMCSLANIFFCSARGAILCPNAPNSMDGTRAASLFHVLNTSFTGKGKGGGKRLQLPQLARHFRVAIVARI